MATTHTHTHKKPPVGVFLSAVVVFFFMTLSAADSIGFVPYYIDGTPPSASRTGGVNLSNLPELGEEERRAEEAVPGTLPERIIIPSLSLDLPVQNPSTRDINKLDQILQSGPARYVDSALLGKRGNVLIFAHSSNLPVVHNPMFKAFNRVPELAAGDSINIRGADGKTYLYSVISVRTANASEELIDLSPELGRRLTLVTCNTLASKDARFIVEAELVGEF